jgi:ribosome-associated protein
MKKNELKQQVSAAVAACEDKKADRLSILELEKSSGAFTDYFVICSGTNPRQIQAISDEVGERLAKLGLRAKSVEGYKQAEWVLLDYVDFVVHVFSEKSRDYYDLERLWKSAKRLNPAELAGKPAASSARPKAGAKTAARPAKKATKKAAKKAAKTPAKRTARAASATRQKSSRSRKA